MPITVKHKFICSVPDDPDATLVRPSNWNDTHDIEGLGTAAEADVSDFVTSLAACASITTTNISNWDTAFSWGDHSAAGYVQLISGALVIGDTVKPSLGSFDNVATFKGTGASIAGRTMCAIQNTNTTSAAAIGLFNSNNTKRLFFTLTNSSYALPNLAAVTTEGNTPFYFVTDGNVASGGTSNIFFRLGGYDVAADAFCFDYRKRLGIATIAPSYDLSFGGNSARVIWLERNTTANTAGNSLTIQAGGSTTGATDKNGGDLVLAGGVATGTGESSVKIQTAVAGASGTATRLSTNIMFQALGNKMAFNGATPVTKPTVTGSRGGNAALASLLTALDTLGLITDSTTA